MSYNLDEFSKNLDIYNPYTKVKRAGKVLTTTSYASKPAKGSNTKKLDNDR